MSDRPPMNLHLKKNALHEQLHISKDKPISESRLHKALGSNSPIERKRAQFAENARHWNHGGK